MRRARTTKSVFAALTAASLLALSACGGDDEADDPAETPAAQTEETPTAGPTDEPTEPETDEPAGGGSEPDWAAPVTTPGEQITTIEIGDITVDVYQVGTAPAPKDGSWVDPDTNEPLIAEGDPLVFVNYVVTNNGDSIDLGASLVNIEARYDDWQWMQGMGGIVDFDLYEEQGVNRSATAPDGHQESGVYTFGSGEQYSVAENFHHQEDSAITFKATVTPVDSEGELLHDDRQEAEASGTIQ